MSHLARSIIFLGSFVLFARESGRKKPSGTILWFCLIIGVLGVVGCTSTVTPGIVEPAQASYSGPVRNSGVIQRRASGWIVDGNFRARYNALIERYGDEFLPRLRMDAGMLPIAAADTPEAERWLIDPQHFEKMLTMNIEHHSGIPPLKQ